MKKEEKRMIFILLIVAVLIIGGLLLWKNTINSKIQEETPWKENKEREEKEKYISILEDGTKLNKSEKLHKTKKIDGLEISDIQLTYKKGQSILLANVTNTTNTDKDITKIEVILYDDKGNELQKLNGLILALKAGQSTRTKYWNTRRLCKCI